MIYLPWRPRTDGAALVKIPMTPSAPLPDEPIGTHFIDTGALRPIDELADRFAELTGFVYEVVRIIDGVPLFLEEHAARLFRSAQLTGAHDAVPVHRLAGFIDALIEQNGLTAGNVKAALGVGGSSEGVCLVSFIVSRYPETSLYRDGVTIGIFHGERQNPTVKRHDLELRRRLRAELEGSGHYDLLMENAAGYLTEGSRTNVFFVDHDILVTPPEEDVLPGITRLKVIELAARASIPLTEKRIRREDLHLFDAAFLTGTSAKLLPVHVIDDHPLRVDHPLIRRLMADYDRLIDEYIETARAASA